MKVKLSNDQVGLLWYIVREYYPDSHIVDSMWSMTRSEIAEGTDFTYEDWRTCMQALRMESQTEWDGSAQELVNILDSIGLAIMVEDSL